LSWLLDLSPISVVAALAAGAANGAAFALAPIYALGIGVKPAAAPHSPSRSCSDRRSASTPRAGCPIGWTDE
jgi:hypothetical protein